MNSAEKVAKLLAQVGKAIPIKVKKKFLGLFPYVVHHGWLWIDDHSDHWHVAIASDERNHCPQRLDYMGVNISKETGERIIGECGNTGAWQVAMSLWPVRDEEKAVRYTEAVLRATEQAYEYLFSI